jgi:hypothetical protein
LNVATHHRRSWISLLVAAAVSVGISQSLVAQPSAPEQGAPGQLKTLAVVAGTRYEKLIGDVTFLGPYLGQPAAGPMAEMMLAQFTMNKAATALDKTKPWGVIVQTDGAQFFYVACLPIANGDDIIEVAKAYSAEVKDGENGTKELSIPNKPPIFLKTENGVSFLSIAQASLAKLPPNALEILGKRVGEYDLSVSLAVKNIPDMYRQFAIGAMQAGMQQNMKKQADETDEQFADRQKLAEAQIGQITQLINEVDTMKVAWAIDAAEKRTFVDFEYQFVSGSKMAQQMASYSQPNTKFAGFHQPAAAVTGVVSTQADPKLMADNMGQLDSMMHSMRSQAAREIEKKHPDPQEQAALKAAANDIFDAIEGTIKEGLIDGGASLNASPGSLTFVSGFHIKEPAKIEGALKKIEEVAKTKPNFPGIKWNAANHAGVNFHTLSAPLPEGKPEPRKMFGETFDLTVGIGPDAVYVAFGKDNVAALEKAIDASAADQNKKVPPFALSISLGQIMAVAADVKEGPEKPALEAIAKKLNATAKGQDHIYVGGEVLPNGVRYRFAAEEGALQAVGIAAKMKQQARHAPPGN